jgi:mono/diheme cytochrome c family protein
MMLAAIMLAATALAPASDGRELFTARCGGCHLEGGFGTGAIARSHPGEPSLLAQRRPPADLVRAVVRNGYRSMPPIRRAELDDAALGSIAGYLAGGQ